ncbi:unnamed protein product [Amoebophrya sp. A120]|nr:unnamed protein product [Amoebophrya sp. A120]|eukprot:GSA120T00018089001.1
MTHDKKIDYRRRINIKMRMTEHGKLKRCTPDPSMMFAPIHRQQKFTIIHPREYIPGGKLKLCETVLEGVLAGSKEEDVLARNVLQLEEQLHSGATQVSSKPKKDKPFTVERFDKETRRHVEVEIDYENGKIVEDAGINKDEQALLAQVKDDTENKADDDDAPASTSLVADGLRCDGAVDQHGTSVSTEEAKALLKGLYTKLNWSKSVDEEPTSGGDGAAAQIKPDTRQQTPFTIGSTFLPGYNIATAATDPVTKQKKLWKIWYDDCFLQKEGDYKHNPAARSLIGSKALGAFILGCQVVDEQKKQTYWGLVSKKEVADLVFNRSEGKDSHRIEQEMLQQKAQQAKLEALGMKFQSLG